MSDFPSRVFGSSVAILVLGGLFILVSSDFFIRFGLEATWLAWLFFAAGIALVAVALVSLYRLLRYIVNARR